MYVSFSGSVSAVVQPTLTSPRPPACLVMKTVLVVAVRPSLNVSAARRVIICTNCLTSTLSVMKVAWMDFIRIHVRDYEIKLIAKEILRLIINSYVWYIIQEQNRGLYIILVDLTRRLKLSIDMASGRLCPSAPL